MAKKVGWSNTQIGNKGGKPKGPAKGKSDAEEFDLGEFDLGDDQDQAAEDQEAEVSGDEDVDDPALEDLLGDLTSMESEKPKEPEKPKGSEPKGKPAGVKPKKAVAPRIEEPAPDEELLSGLDDMDPEDAEQELRERRATKENRGSEKVVREKPGAKTSKPEEKVAKDLGLDLRMQCPVCRSLDPCKCDEDDRAFVQRTRFEEKVEKVARCPRDQAPLSVLYLPRPGARPPFRLSQFTAHYGCAVCHGDALATVLLSRGAQ